MSLLAIIPARGGSKGIPRKNIKDFCGKPLIAWTIQEALESKYVDRVIVSTDDKEIKNISLKFGAEVPFLRPKELSRDNSQGIDVMLHAINIFSNFERIVYLQPTSPFRTVIDIDSAYEFALDKDADSLVPIVKSDKNVHWFLSRDSDSKVKRIMNSGFSSNRQNLPDAFLLCGSIFLYKTEWLSSNRKLMSKNSYGFEIPSERAYEIDTTQDWDFAEYLMSKKMK